MKTIKIFPASSEELDYDRVAFCNLVRKLAREGHIEALNSKERMKAFKLSVE